MTLAPAQIETLSQAAYETLRLRGSSLPAWPQVEPAYKAEWRAQVMAVVAAGEARGFLSINEMERT